MLDLAMGGALRVASEPGPGSALIGAVLEARTWMHWLEHAPILLIGVALMGLLVAGHELGFQAARRLFPKTSGAQELGNVIASALTLLGLLVAFTFSAAQARFNLRQQ